ncbi:hypothetical protein ABTC32_19115, partial [Acinetobacter baumannii]
GGSLQAHPYLLPQGRGGGGGPGGDAGGLGRFLPATPLCLRPGLDGPPPDDLLRAFPLNGHQLPLDAPHRVATPAAGGQAPK